MKHLLLLLATASLTICSCQQKSTPQIKTSESGVHLPQVNDNSPFMRMEKRALQDPFEGIATSAGLQDGLFSIRATGISTRPIVEAAADFITTLTPQQKDKTIFSVYDDEWRKWCNVDNGIYRRHGISIKEMNQEQRKLAFQLLSESLSAKGLQLSKDIMKTDQTLRELNNDDPIFDEDLYFFTIMGEPSDKEPWGWQIDGHHLVINYFVMGDQVVMTPTFMGGEPIVTTSGKYKGNTIFQDEQNLGLKFMQSLPPEQQKEATLSTTKGREGNQAEAFKDNITLDYEGLRVFKMSETHRRELLHLTNQYISNTREGHAEVKMEEVERHIEDTYFAWIGATDDDAVFYYRIHSPVVLIEFDHQGPIGVPGVGGGATRNHIHTIVRTPNGNDYGRDLLRQHLEEHHH